MSQLSSLVAVDLRTRSGRRRVACSLPLNENTDALLLILDIHRLSAFSLPSG